MTYKLYTLDNKLIEETDVFPVNFTGVCIDNGTKHYYLNGERHRLVGPAVESYGLKQYWINGSYITNSYEQFNLYIDIMKLKGLL